MFTDAERRTPNADDDDDDGQAGHDISSSVLCTGELKIGCNVNETNTYILTNYVSPEGSGDILFSVEFPSASASALAFPSFPEQNSKTTG